MVFADYRVWHTQYYSPAGNPLEIELCRLPNLEMASCISTAARAKWQHIWTTVDTNDTSVWPENGYNLCNTLKSLGDATAENDYWYIFDPYPGGHTSGYNQPAIYNFFRGITNNRYPKQIKLTTNRLKYGEQYWLRIDRLQTANVFANVDATITDNTISVTASNVLAYTLTLDAHLVNSTQPIAILTNGFLSYQGTAGVITLYAQLNAGVITGWSTSALKSTSLWKKAGLEGPIGDAYTSRFVVFYGASGSTDDIENNLAEAQDFCYKWQLWMNATITPHPDTELRNLLAQNWTNTIYGDCNIILFGAIDSSTVLQSMQQQLPISVYNNGVIIGTQQFFGNQYGAYFVYPNPRNPQKYLVVNHGSIRVPALTQQTWISDPSAYAKDLEALPWYWPDYVIFNTQVTPRVTAQVKLAYLPDAFVKAGYFDANWQLPIASLPDLQIDTTESEFVGDGIYNTDIDQTITQQATIGVPVSFDVLIQNDASQTDTIGITGVINNSGATVQYYLGTEDVTSFITDPQGNGLVLTLTSGMSQLLRVKAVLTGATAASKVTITARSLQTINGVAATDTVIANIQQQEPLLLRAFTVDKPSAKVYEPVVLTAASSGGWAVQYQFQMGTTRRDWSSNNTFTWTPATVGAYTLNVFARSGGAGTPVSLAFPGVYQVSLPDPPIITSFTLTPPDKAVVGKSVQVTATTSGGTQVQYQFQLGTQLSSWSSNNTFSFLPTIPGPCQVTVFARSGQAGEVVQQQLAYYYINASLSAVTLKLQSKSPHVRSTITLTATPVGGGTLEYKFSYLFNGKTILLRDWSTGNICTWKPGRRGQFTLIVAAREAGTTFVVTKASKYFIR